jgi:hypothetical protein
MDDTISRYHFDGGSAFAQPKHTTTSGRRRSGEGVGREGQGEGGQSDTRLTSAASPSSPLLLHHPRPPARLVLAAVWPLCGGGVLLSVPRVVWGWGARPFLGKIRPVCSKALPPHDPARPPRRPVRGPSGVERPAPLAGGEAAGGCQTREGPSRGAPASGKSPPLHCPATAWPMGAQGAHRTKARRARSRAGRSRVGGEECRVRGGAPATPQGPCGGRRQGGGGGFRPWVLPPHLSAPSACRHCPSTTPPRGLLCSRALSTSGGAGGGSCGGDAKQKERRGLQRSMRSSADMALGGLRRTPVAQPHAPTGWVGSGALHAAGLFSLPRRGRRRSL